MPIETRDVLLSIFILQCERTDEEQDAPNSQCDYKLTPPSQKSTSRSDGNHSEPKYSNSAWRRCEGANRPSTIEIRDPSKR